MVAITYQCASRQPSYSLSDCRGLLAQLTAWPHCCAARCAADWASSAAGHDRQWRPVNSLPAVKPHQQWTKQP